MDNFNPNESQIGCKDYNSERNFVQNFGRVNNSNNSQNYRQESANNFPNNQTRDVNFNNESNKDFDNKFNNNDSQRVNYNNNSNTKYSRVDNFNGYKNYSNLNTPKANFNNFNIENDDFQPPFIVEKDIIRNQQKSDIKRQFKEAVDLDKIEKSEYNKGNDNKKQLKSKLSEYNKGNDEYNNNNKKYDEKKKSSLKFGTKLKILFIVYAVVILGIVSLVLFNALPNMTDVSAEIPSDAFIVDQDLSDIAIVGGNKYSIVLVPDFSQQQVDIDTNLFDKICDWLSRNFG